MSLELPQKPKQTIPITTNTKLNVEPQAPSSTDSSFSYSNTTSHNILPLNNTHQSSKSSQKEEPKLGGSSTPHTNDHVLDFTKWIGLVFSPSLELNIPVPLFEGVGNLTYPLMMQDIKLFSANNSKTYGKISNSDQIFLPIVTARLELETILFKKITLKTNIENNQSSETYKPYNNLLNLYSWLNANLIEQLHPDSVFSFDLMICLQKYRLLLENAIKTQPIEILMNWIFSWCPFFTGINGELFIILYMLGLVYKRVASINLIEILNFVKITPSELEDDLFKQITTNLSRFASSSTPSDPIKEGPWINFLNLPAEKIAEKKNTTSTELRRSIFFLNGALETFFTAKEMIRTVAKENEHLYQSYLIHKKDSFGNECVFNNFRNTLNEPSSEFGFFPILKTPILPNSSQSSTIIDKATEINTTFNQELCFSNQLLPLEILITNLDIHGYHYLLHQITFLFFTQTSTTLKHKIYFQLAKRIQHESNNIVSLLGVLVQSISNKLLSQSPLGKKISKIHTSWKHFNGIYEALVFSHTMVYAWSKKNYKLTSSICNQLQRSLSISIGKAAKKNISKITIIENQLALKNTNQKPLDLAEIFTKINPPQKSSDFVPMIESEKNQEELISSLKSLLSNSIKSSVNDSSNTNHVVKCALSPSPEIIFIWDNIHLLNQNTTIDQLKTVLFYLISHISFEAKNIWRESASYNNTESQELKEINVPLNFNMFFTPTPVNISVMYDTDKTKLLSQQNFSFMAQWNAIKSNSKVLLMMNQGILKYHHFKPNTFSIDTFDIIITSLTKQIAEITTIVQTLGENNPLLESDILLSLIRACTKNLTLLQEAFK